MKKHAKLSPSAAHRWLTCTAAPTLEARYEDQTSGYAEEGTFAHRLAELCTRNALGMITRRQYLARLKKLAGDEYYSPEMLEYCEEYAFYIKEKFLAIAETCPDAFVELEVKLDLTSIIPEGFGTADCIIIAEPEIWVIDFKYGKGVKVEAEGNQQMEIYALGAMAKYKPLYDIRSIGMAIVQPRLGGISETKIDAGALRAWALIEIIPQAKEAFEGPGHFRPGDEACRFCKARQDCRARADYYVSLFEDDEDAGLLTADEAGRLLEKAAGMKDWLKDLEAKVTGTLFRGEPVEGWKLVAGRSNRKFTDEEKVAAVLGTETDMTQDEIFKTKLIGISEIEKRLGKKKTAELLGKWIIKPEAVPVLAPADDKRPEVKPAEAIVNAFDE